MSSFVKFHEGGVFRPVRVVLWNDPEPVDVEFYPGDLLVSVENFKDEKTRRWGWAYTLLRPVEEEGEESP